MVDEQKEPSDDVAPTRAPRHASRRLLYVLAALAWVAVAVLVVWRLTAPGEVVVAPAHPDAGPAATDRELRVVVATPDGPAAGAEMGVEGVEGTQRAATDGTATLRIAGPGTLRVTLGGFARARVAFTNETEVRVALEAGWRVAGVVRADDGTPIVGARVTAVPDGVDEIPAQRATADAEGRFVIDTLEPRAQRFAVTAPGFEEGLRLVTAPGDFEWTLARVAEIRGTVVDAEGRLAPGATVVIAGSGIWPPRSVETDPEGVFRLLNVPPGVYELRARRGSDVTRPREGLAIDAQAVVDVQLRLAPGATLVGQVVDATTEQGVAGAEIVVTENGLGLEPRVTTSDGEGRFSVAGLLLDTHRVSVSLAGYVPEQRLVRPDVPLVVPLSRGATLRGQVVDGRGRGIEGATLALAGSREDGGPLVFAIGATSGFERELLAMQTAGPVSAGAGELGVTLGVVPPIPLGPSSAVRAGPSVAPSSEQTDERGEFELHDVPPGRLQVVVRHPSFASQSSPVLLVVAGRVQEGIRIILAPAGVIAGRVVDGRGFAAPSLLVEARVEGDPVPRMAVADDNGEFRFDGVAGATTLTAFPLGRPAARTTVRVAPGATIEVVLSLEGETRTLRGRALDDRGFPLAEVRIAVRSLRPGAPAEASTVSGEDGAFEVAGLPAPPWRIEADHPSFAHAVIPRVDDPDHLVEVRLGTAGAVRGRVLDEWGSTPLPNTAVRVERDGEVIATTLTDELGQFEVQRVPTGDYDVFFEADGYLPFRARGAVVARRWGVEDADLGDLGLVAGGGVSGLVVDVRGDVVPGAELAFGAEPNWTTAIRTDARGRFQRRGLPAGENLIFVRHPAAGEAFARAQVRAGDEVADLRIVLPQRFDPDRAGALGEGSAVGVPARLEEANGAVRVARVMPGSAAARAGLRAGDLVAAIDDEPVTSLDQARQLLRGAQGIDALLDVQRGDRNLRLVAPRETYDQGL